MNGAPFSEGAPANASRGELMSALFAGMVMQQTNMALMLLGKIPHPESGQTLRDVEGARMFIDQLEMLEFKTRGNLDKQEERLLKQSLTALRLAFVEAIDNEPGQPQPAPSATASEPVESAEPAKPSDPASQPAPPPSDEDSRKKFSKRY
ncbi:MAG: hypothetical protein DME19_08690 [Verrucomicrobia bacterium]|nr:MAG: hypothetical protein DME19_08690 [Verrucomicrobiota bacterium]